LDRFLVILGLIIGFSLIGQAWWRFSGWIITNMADNIRIALVPIAYLIIGFIIIVFSPFVPKLGTHWFYHKIKDKTYRNMILDQIEGKSTEEKFNISKALFNIKENIINWFFKTKFKPVYIFGLLLNFLIFWLLLGYFTTGRIVEDTEISNIAGYLFGFSVGWNYLTLFLAATMYSNKANHNLLSRVSTEFLSWVYAFILPFGFLQFIAGKLIQFQYLTAIPTATGLSLIDGAQGIFRLTVLIIIALQGLLFFKTPDDTRNTNTKMDRGESQSFFRIIYSKGRWFLSTIFVFTVFVAFILSVLILITDPLYIFNVMGYMINLLYLFFIFGALKLVKSQETIHGRIHISKRFIAKIGAIILIINTIPAIGTILGTNPNLEKQFASVFGDDWETQLIGSGITTKNLPFSSWEAFFTGPVPSNGFFGIPYGIDHPRYVITGNQISNGSEKFPDIVHEFKFDLYLPAGQANNFFPVNLTPGDGNFKKYPLVVMIHGLAADRGIMNANITSQILANYGYAVCDVSYGDFDAYNASEINSTQEKGYDLPDTIFQIANFLHFIENNSDYYHVDVSNTALVGRSWGGLMSLIIAYGYNHSFFAGNFSSNLSINSVVVYYPTSKILTGGENLFNLGKILTLTDNRTPIIRGSDNPVSGTYNAQWIYFDPFFLSGEESGQAQLPNTMILQGTHDFGIAPGWSRDLENHLRNNLRTVIAGYYPLGAHGFDALVWSPFGQSTLYYMCRFLQLSNA
jgi:dienelactone hydrolase